MSRVLRGIHLYFSNVIVYGGGLWTLEKIHFYQQFMSNQAWDALWGLFLIYTILSPLYYMMNVQSFSTNKAFYVVGYCTKSIKGIFSRKIYPLIHQEKVAILFMAVKFFFLPLMVQFFISNWNVISRQGFSWTYPFFLTLIFAIDTFVFGVGYSIEMKSLKNVVKSVEPTIFGWVVTLLCYPPFNGIVGQYIPWGANDYASFGSMELTIIARIGIIVLFLVYLAATFSLGFKASNLTNRGIVTKGPYAYIRHPAYISKNLVWWITLIPVMNWYFFWGMSFWSILYFFRAMTEERHLLMDPDYKEYCKKVKFRFIPGFF